MIVSFVHQTILLIMYTMYTKCLKIILTIVCTWYEEGPCRDLRGLSLSSLPKYQVTWAYFESNLTI